MKEESSDVMRVRFHSISPCGLFAYVEECSQYRETFVLHLLRVLAMLIMCTWSAEAATFPVKVSSNARYLVDQNNQPFWLMVDSPWSLMVALTTNEVVTYLDDRQAKGFNAVIVNLVEHKFKGCDNVFQAPKNRYGNAPFSNSNDFTTTNENYFVFSDFVIDECAKRGIVLLLNPMYLGYANTDEGWYAEVLVNGTNKCRSYGQFVGNRYKSKPNIIWTMFGDNKGCGSWGDAREEMAAMVEGIKDYDTNHIFTAHIYGDISAQNCLGAPAWLDLNNVYTWYGDVIALILNAWKEAPTRPVFLFEHLYEGYGGTTAYSIRKFRYWSYLSGGMAGTHYGNDPVWKFGSGWRTNLTTQGTASMTYMKKLFMSRSWWLLQPDDAHTVVTNGYGSGGNYVAAARTADGETVIAYLPAGNTITVALASISGSQAKCWWYNPRDGTASNVGSFATSGSQVFSAPTAEDWVLVLDNAARPFSPPGSVIAPVELMITAVSTNYVIWFNATPGETHCIEYSEELSHKTWHTSGIVTANTFGLSQIIDSPLAALPQRFYRARSL